MSTAMVGRIFSLPFSPIVAAKRRSCLEMQDLRRGHRKRARSTLRMPDRSVTPQIPADAVR